MTSNRNPAETLFEASIAKAFKYPVTIPLGYWLLICMVFILLYGCGSSQKTTLFYSGEGKYMIFVKPLKLQQKATAEPKVQMMADFTHHVSTQAGQAPEPTVFNFSLIGPTAIREITKITFGDEQNPDTIITQTGQIKLLFIEPKGKSTLSRYNTGIHGATFRKWVDQFPTIHIKTINGQVLHFNMPTTWQKKIAPSIKQSL